MLLETGTANLMHEGTGSNTMYFSILVTSPEVPTYSYNNTGALSAGPLPAVSATMDTAQPVNIQSMDKMAMGSVTVAQSETSNVNVQDVPFNILQQIALMKMQQEAARQHQQQQQQRQPAASQGQAAGTSTQNFDMNNYVTQTTGAGVVYSDVSMQQAAGVPTQENQTATADLPLQMLQQYLGDQGTSSVSFESLDGLSGNLMNLDYDPNIGAMENVSSDGANQRQVDETHQAVNALNNS